MAGSILDILSDPSLLSQLLGGSYGGSPPPPPPQPQPQPPMNGGIGSDAGQAPGAPQPAGMMPMPPQPPQPMASNQGFDESGFAIKPDYVPPPAQPQPYPNAIAGAFGSDPANAPMPPGAPPQTPPPPPQTAMMPMPPPRPQMALPPGATPTAGQAPPGPPMNILPPGGNQLPMGAQPAPRPPASQFQNVPTASVADGGLAGAFGLNPQTQRADQLRAMMSGVGKGLSAVGAQPLGTSKGAAFAAGAGGSLTGTADAQQKQKDTLFNQSSTAFKDMLAAKAGDNTAAYRQAQSQYLAARAASLQSMTAAGGKGSNAWQNTPYGKVIGVENEAQKFEKGQQIILQKRWALNGATPEQQQQDLDRLNKSVDAYRNRLYTQAGVDPKQADKIKDMGTSAQNPFDTKGMSLDQFHAQVPMPVQGPDGKLIGGWFKDQNGVVRQRTVPPPGAQSQAPAQQPAAPGTATNYDDMAAMSPAA